MWAEIDGEREKENLSTDLVLACRVKTIVLRCENQASHPLELVILLGQNVQAN